LGFFPRRRQAALYHENIQPPPVRHAVER
jgi:hypothetical protein